MKTKLKAIDDSNVKVEMEEDIQELIIKQISEIINCFKRNVPCKLSCKKLMNSFQQYKE